RTAELFHELTGKGKQVAICGQLRYNTYNDKNGKPQRTTQIFVQEFLVLSPADKHSSK
ncbi:MAG: single-stranded DNA-binding protein, partial [Saprospiraceae bacterium]|nr:single-stranded DNA-binding protein [Saprospiraceae bacterium]